MDMNFDLLLDDDEEEEDEEEEEEVRAVDDFLEVRWKDTIMV